MRANHFRSPRRSTQRGAVLFVTLMILLIITILGIASMRLGLTQSVISRNATVDNVLFQSSEAVLNVVMTEATICDNTNSCQSISNVVGGAASGTPTIRCLTNEGVKSVSTVADCGKTILGVASNYMDKKGTIRAYAVTTSTGGTAPLEGTDMAAFGGASFKTEATSEIPSLGVSTTHVQEFYKVAPSPEALD